MAERKNLYSAGVESDRRLLQYDKWTDYLDSLIEVEDLKNLRSIHAARIITSLGFRTNGDTLSEKEFNKRRAVIHEVVYPTLRPYVLASENCQSDDPFVKELSYRERQNRLGIIQSIIFVRNVTSGGFEVSGHVDFAARLGQQDWTAFFQHGRKLWPKPDDLSYYHWRLGTTRSSTTRNYIPVIDAKKGVLYQNRHDFKVIWPQPGQDPGPNTKRFRIMTPNYTQIEIFDHVVRVRTE